MQETTPARPSFLGGVFWQVVVGVVTGVVLAEILKKN